jgi:hypothetical protein
MSMKHVERTGADARRDYIAAIAAAGTRIAELAAEVEMEVAALAVPTESWAWVGDLADVVDVLSVQTDELRDMANRIHARRSVHR